MLFSVVFSSISSRFVLELNGDFAKRTQFSAIESMVKIFEGDGLFPARTVYGIADRLPQKDTPTNPISRYGISKLRNEWTLADTAKVLARPSSRCVTST
jgi:hypothetical protein